ncbi:hypothetical protein [Xanthomonas phage RTH11]|nr:hypothetical protein [Xanthomonas phage RTH11]
MSNAMIDASGGIAALLDGMNNELNDRMAMLAMDPAIAQAVENYLVSGLQTIRFPMINDEIVLGDIWSVIRGQEALVDLVVDLTNSLHFQASLTFPGGWAKLQELVVAGLTCFNNAPQGDLTSVWHNSEEMGYFATADQLTPLVRTNPWLITLYLLRRTVFVRELLRASVVRAAQARQNARTGGT